MFRNRVDYASYDILLSLRTRDCCTRDIYDFRCTNGTMRSEDEHGRWERGSVKWQFFIKFSLMSRTKQYRRNAINVDELNTRGTTDGPQATSGPRSRVTRTVKLFVTSYYSLIYFLCFEGF
jgi:hypothetical protein